MKMKYRDGEGPPNKVLATGNVRSVANVTQLLSSVRVLIDTPHSFAAFSQNGAQRERNTRSKALLITIPNEKGPGLYFSQTSD